MNLDKDRELAEAQSEIKGLRLTERAKDKALAEVASLEICYLTSMCLLSRGKSD